MSSSEPIVQIWPHYEVMNSIKSMADLRKLFPSGAANTLNWCFLSTSGVHGSYSTLDQIHEYDETDEEMTRDEQEELARHITVLVVHPRLVCMKYGVVTVETDEDEAWLRALVRSSIEAVKESQEGNL